MSSILACKIELDGSRIFSKPLNLKDSLDAIREIIKGRVPSSFVFLDQDNNIIEKIWMKVVLNWKILKKKRL